MGLNYRSFLAAITMVATLAFACKSSSALPKQGPQIKLTITEGSTLSDIVTVTAKVSASAGADIDKVEFAVDDQLKFTDQSTPYEFDLDTLTLTEGTHSLSATAFDTKGKTAIVKLTVSIDNELTKGAPALAAMAADSLKAGETDKAGNYARRALKVDTNNFTAARIQANIFRSKGEYLKGIEVLSKLTLPDDEIEVRTELVALHVMKGDASVNTEDFIAESTQAAAIYQKINLARIKSAKMAVGDAETTAILRGDAYFAAMDWTNALKEYQSVGNAATGSLQAVNRTILTYLRAGRLKEANLALSQTKRANHSDSITASLWGLYYIAVCDYKKAEEALAAPTTGGIIGAQIASGYIAVKNGHMKIARGIADKLKETAPSLAETQLLLSNVESDPIDAKAAFTRAVFLSPTSAEPYVVRGGQTLNTSDAGRYKLADPIFDFALKLDPKSSFAMVGRSLSYLNQKKPNDAEPMVLQLLDREPSAPDIHFIAAAMYQLQDKQGKITDQLAAAFKLDPDKWADAFVPKLTELTVRVFRYRFAPMISIAAFYPTVK